MKVCKTETIPTTIYYGHIFWAAIKTLIYVFACLLFYFKLFYNISFLIHSIIGPNCKIMVIKNVINHLLIQISCSNRLELLKYDRSLDFLGRLRSIVRKCLLLFFSNSLNRCPISISRYVTIISLTDSVRFL